MINESDVCKVASINSLLDALVDSGNAGLVASVMGSYSGYIASYLHELLEDCCSLSDSDDVAVTTAAVRALTSLSLTYNSVNATLHAHMPLVLSSILPNLFYTTSAPLLDRCIDLLYTLQWDDVMIDVVEALVMQNRRLMMLLDGDGDGDAVDVLSNKLVVLLYNLVCLDKSKTVYNNVDISVNVYKFLTTICSNVKSHNTLYHLCRLYDYGYSCDGVYNDLLLGVLIDNNFVVDTLKDDNEEYEFRRGTYVETTLNNMYANDRVWYINYTVCKLQSNRSDVNVIESCLYNFTVVALSFVKRCGLYNASNAVRYNAFKATKQGHFSDSDIDREISVHVDCVNFIVNTIHSNVDSIHSISDSDVREGYIRTNMEVLKKYSLFILKHNSVNPSMSPVVSPIENPTVNPTANPTATGSTLTGIGNACVIKLFQLSVLMNNAKVIELGCEVLRNFLSKAPTLYNDVSSLKILLECYTSLPKSCSRISREGLCNGLFRVFLQLDDKTCKDYCIAFIHLHVNVIKTVTPNANNIDEYVNDVYMLGVCYRQFHIPSRNTLEDDNQTSIVYCVLLDTWAYVTRLFSFIHHDSVREVLGYYFKQVLLIPCVNPGETLRVLTDGHCSIASNADPGVLYEWINDVIDVYSTSDDKDIQGCLGRLFDSCVINVCSDSVSYQLDVLSCAMIKCPTTVFGMPAFEPYVHNVVLVALEQSSDDINLTRNCIMFFKRLFEIQDTVGALCISPELRPERNVGLWSFIGGNVTRISGGVRARVLKVCVEILMGRGSVELTDPVGGLIHAAVSRWEGAIPDTLPPTTSPELKWVITNFLTAVQTKRIGCTETQDFCEELYKAVSSGIDAISVLVGKYNGIKSR